MSIFEGITVDEIETNPDGVRDILLRDFKKHGKRTVVKVIEEKVAKSPVKSAEDPKTPRRASQRSLAAASESTMDEATIKHIKELKGIMKGKTDEENSDFIAGIYERGDSEKMSKAFEGVLDRSKNTKNSQDLDFCNHLYSGLLI